MYMHYNVYLKSHFIGKTVEKQDAVQYFSANINGHSDAGPDSVSD